MNESLVRILPDNLQLTHAFEIRGWKRGKRISGDVKPRNRRLEARLTRRNSLVRDALIRTRHRIGKSCGVFTLAVICINEAPPRTACGWLAQLRTPLSAILRASCDCHFRYILAQTSWA